jgi:hypothetical protein
MNAIRIVMASLLALLAAGAAPQQPPAVRWRALQPGVELAIVAGGGGPLYVVRVDPRRAKLAAGLASKTGRSQTAAEWCRTSRFSVAINLGMYEADHRTHTGYLRDGAHLNNGRVNDYRSLLALRPAKSGLPPALWVDLPSAALPPALAPYDLVVQNLRLIAGDRKNVWTPTNRRWSEAALAIDSKGRLLFLFSRAPYSMPEFNALILRLPLDVRQAMHVEGGPEASLSVHAGGVDLDLCGSFETGFVEDESNRDQWPLPNVLAVVREDAAR